MFRVRHTFETSILNAERIRQISKENRIKSTVRMNWMILFNYEIMVSFFHKMIQNHKAKTYEAIKKQLLALRIQKIWKIYNVIFQLKKK